MLFGLRQFAVFAGARSGARWPLVAGMVLAQFWHGLVPVAHRVAANGLPGAVAVLAGAAHGCARATAPGRGHGSGFCPLGYYLALAG